MAVGLVGALAVTAPAALSATTVRDLPDGLVPFSVAAGPDGRTWFVAADRRMYADFSTPEGVNSYAFRGVVGSVGAAGDVRTVVDVHGADPKLPVLPRDVVFGRDGNLYGAGSSTGAVFRVTTAGEVAKIQTTAKTVGTVALGPDRRVWFGSGSGSRVIGRIGPTGTAEAIDAGLTSSQRSFAAGPGGEMWVVDGAGRLLRVRADGRTRQVRFQGPRLIKSVVRSSDGHMWVLNRQDPNAGLWRVSANGAVKTTCSFRPLVNFEGELVPGSDGSVWAMAGVLRADSSSYPVRVSRTGEVVGFPSALPRGTNRVWDLAAGPGGALLIAYRSGPDDLTQQQGHIARVTPSATGKRLCRGKLRDRR